MFYCKLVRDKIPQIITAAGKKPITRILDQEDKEYHESKDAEELADILEVLITLAKLKGLTFADLMDLQTKKFVKKGGFSKKILLKAVCDKENS